jgi:hypothetical protein
MRRRWMDGRKDTTACHEETEANTEKMEPDPGISLSIGEYQEVSKEEAAVMLVGGLRKRRRDRNLAAGRRQKRKGRIQACEFWKKLTVAKNFCSLPYVLHAPVPSSSLNILYCDVYTHC